MIITADRLPENSVQQTGARVLAKKKEIIFKSFMDQVETNQSLGLAPTGRAVQLRPTSPEISDALVPEGRWGATSAAEGDSALLPIIEVSFHSQYYNDLGRMKLTASKMSRGALATLNSAFRREGRGDAGALVGLGVGRLAGRAGRVGVVVGTRSGGSCKSGKGESEDDFELHIAFFLCCNTEH